MNPKASILSSGSVLWNRVSKGAVTRSAPFDTPPKKLAVTPRQARDNAQDAMLGNALYIKET